MKRVKEKIIKLLQDERELFTAEIAKKLKISSTTASRYLAILEAEGKIISSVKTPYKYWGIKNKNSGDKK